MNTSPSTWSGPAQPTSKPHAPATPVHNNRAWLWRVGLEWLALSAWPLALLVSLKPMLLRFWQWVISSWSSVLGLSITSTWSPTQSSLQWAAMDDGSFAPSSISLALTVSGLALLWLWSGSFSDRMHPLKITLRALCVIHLSACLVFILAPASFPYSVSKHLFALLDMGYGFMLAIPPMLALGWGILKVPVWQKVLVPCLVLLYFALMLPHKALLHAWVLDNFSLLFMPLLFFCFGSLLDLWIFIALYGWLASLASARPQHAGRAAP